MKLDTLGGEGRGEGYAPTHTPRGSKNNNIPLSEWYVDISSSYSPEMNPIEQKIQGKKILV